MLAGTQTGGVDGHTDDQQPDNDDTGQQPPEQKGNFGATATGGIECRLLPGAAVQDRQHAPRQAENADTVDKRDSQFSCRMESDYE